MLLNILSNAIKYSEKGSIKIKAQQQAEDLMISISDTGIGIAQEDMRRLFEAFERIDSRLRVKAGGTGLGLYLTKKIVTEILNGQIGAESELGKGSVFWMKIPKVVD